VHIDTQPCKMQTVLVYVRRVSQGGEGGAVRCGVYQINVFPIADGDTVSERASARAFADTPPCKNTDGICMAYLTGRGVYTGTPSLPVRTHTVYVMALHSVPY
jgi:hypothetical protein